MADTLESIVSLSNLGATQLDDGEHTILTTDANTRFVVKDMYVKGTTNLLNSHLELNGMNVGSINNNATGSLIIPPSSTLKIKTTDYPFQFLKTREWAMHSSTLYYKENYGDTAGNSYGNFEYYQSSNISDAAQGYDYHYVKADNGIDYIHQITSDNNSVQRWYANHGNNSNSSVQYQNYRPMGIWDNKIWMFQGGAATFIVCDLETHPTSSSGFNTFTISGSTYTSNDYNPHTQSSYPRAMAAHGFYWFKKNSGDNDIYAINLANKSFHKFDHSKSNAMSSDHGQFVPSIDFATDKLYIYMNDSNGNIHYAVWNNWSTISAQQSSSTTPQQHIKDDEGASSAPYNNSGQNAYMNSGMSRTAMGYDRSGGFTYFSSNQKLVEVTNADDGFQTIAVTETASASGNTQTQPNQGWLKATAAMTDREISQVGLTIPTFDIQLYGIKLV